MSNYFSTLAIKIRHFTLFFMQTSDSQGEKFRQIVEKSGLSIAEVARKLDTTRDTVYAWFKKDSLMLKNRIKISKAFNVDMHKIWPDVNDPMLEAYEFTGDHLVDKAIEKNFTKPKQEITPIPYEDYMMVEYVDLSASAGMLGGSNVDVLPDSKKRLVPREFERGNYLVVRVNGDSMTDGTDISIPDGVEILVKEHVLENGDKLPIRGNLFVVVSRDGNVFKQIVEHNTELGYIKCHSYNPKYEDYIIPMDDVFQIFIYRKIVGYRPNIPEIR
ncbi:helix-turn-helix domain-containing protein [Sphingobacterium sp. DK4209]|nr:helix-turn-helix domain-containing protein [Sphingobacterium sp. DK4209]